MNKNDIKFTFAKYVTLNIIGMLGLSCYICFIVIRVYTRKDNYLNKDLGGRNDNFKKYN